MDYLVLKFPKWHFDKYNGASRRLGTQMKATGEVMSIAPTFEMALMKAVRGAEIGLDTLNAPPLSGDDIRMRLAAQDDRRIFTVFEALKSGLSIDEIYRITMIDPYFLRKLQNLAGYEEKLAAHPMTDALYREGKDLGYTDAALKRLSGADSLPSLHFSYDIVKTCSSVFYKAHPYFKNPVSLQNMIRRSLLTMRQVTL